MPGLASGQLAPLEQSAVQLSSSALDPLTCVREVERGRFATSAVAVPGSDDEGPAGWQSPRDAERPNVCRRIQWPEVDRHDGVFAEMNDVEHLRLPAAEFHTRKVAEEDRVLESLPIGLHDLDHSPESLGIGDVVGDQVASSRHALPRCHRYVPLKFADHDRGKDSRLDIHDAPIADLVAEDRVLDLDVQAAFVRAEH